MRVVVCGGRRYRDSKIVNAVLDTIHAFEPITELYEGGADGADLEANVWAAFNGIKINTECAEWHKYGKRAGMLRNVKMAEQKPDVVISFPGGSGTQNMVTQAITRGIQVIEVKIRKTENGG